MHLRSYREKSKDEITRDLFNVPLQEAIPLPSDPPTSVKVRHKEGSGVGAGMQDGEINAVLSVEGKEEVYVSMALAWRRRCDGEELMDRLEGYRSCHLICVSSLWIGDLVDVPCRCSLYVEWKGEQATRSCEAQS